MSAGRKRLSVAKRGELLPTPSVFHPLEVRPGESSLPACRNCGAELPPIPSDCSPSIALALSMQAERQGYVLQCSSCRTGHLIRCEHELAITAASESAEIDCRIRPEGVWRTFP